MQKNSFPVCATFGQILRLAIPSLTSQSFTQMPVITSRHLARLPATVNLPSSTTIRYCCFEDWRSLRKGRSPFEVPNLFLMNPNGIIVGCFWKKQLECPLADYQGLPIIVKALQ